MSQKNLLKEIVETLRTDAVLVSLTNHDETKPRGFRIAGDEPPVKGRTPFLGVEVILSVPLMDSDVPQMQNAQIGFNCYSTKKLTSADIADRVEFLLQDKSGEANTGYYNFSGGSISNRMTRFKNREGAVFDDKTDVWTSIVEAVVIWVDKTCP